MPESIKIIRSTKTGLNCDESYVVIRNGISYLRILGSEPSWAIMTSTANEDHPHIQVCSDQGRLIESALRLSTEFGVNPDIREDWLTRQYVNIGSITRDPGESKEDFQSKSHALIRRFFELFDSGDDSKSPATAEMDELYDSLATDSHGDVYLSDGVWLSPDGSLHERGR